MGAIAALLINMVLQRAPRVGASARYSARLTLLVTLLVLPLATIAGSLVHANIPAAHNLTPPQAAASHAAVVGSVRGAPLRTSTALVRVAKFWDITDSLPVARTITSSAPRAAQIIIWIWLVGLLIGLARLVLLLARLEQIKRAGVPADYPVGALPRNASLRIVDRLTTPSACGYFRPSILLPAYLLADVERGNLRDILAHETEHLRRFDDWTTLFAHLCSCVLWFNPAVPLIAGQMALDREIACDDYVIAVMGCPRRYAATLWSVAERAVGTAFAAALATKSHVIVRLKHLLTPHPREVASVSRVVLCCAAILSISAVSVAGTIAPAFAWPALRAEIRATSPMAEARADHTATLLPDGKVLIAGGMVRNGEFLNTAELYDPRAGRFTPTGSMSIPRVAATATLLRDGEVLIAGGLTMISGMATATRTAEIYDPVSGTFMPIAPMHVAHAEYTATMLKDGRVLLAGGETGDYTSTASAEVFNPRTKQFTPVGSMRNARGLHAAVALTDGRVLIVGGDYGYRTALSSAEIFNPATNRFELAGSMSVPRTKLAAATLADGSVLIAGGQNGGPFGQRLSSAERYDPTTSRFIPTGRMRDARFKINNDVVLLRNGKVLIAGGAEDAEIYDESTGTFHVVPGSLGGARQFGSATLLGCGSVLIAGGYTLPNPSTNSAAIYRPG